MGVPRLFPWITKSYPSAVTKFQEGERSYNIDVVLLDASGMLHGAAQHVHNYGEKKRMLDPYLNFSPEAKMRKVFEIFFSKISLITSIVVPQKVLYIAIDGTAPSAKQSQQRDRRFIAAKTRKGGSFDSNTLTPGTKFMHELAKYMNLAIRKRMNTRGSPWNGIEVVFSPPTVPGEGEHKCLEYIRYTRPHDKTADSYCFFGPDGDLIMLTLAAHVPKMFLFREDTYNVGYYHLLDMGLIRNELPRDIHPRNIQRTVSEASDDFVLIGFFVGNDFLPRIQMFLYLEDGLALMISRYTSTSHPITTIRDGVPQISKKGFEEFVKTFAADEIQYLMDQSPKHVESDLLFNKILQDAIKVGTSERGMTSKVLDWNQYRKAYYGKAGIAEDEDGIKKMCCDYLRTMAFVYGYYIVRVPSWSYYYPWHYPPLMTDFSEFLHGLTQAEFDEITSFKEVTEPALPFVQLLSVLPPASSHLLPPKARVVMMHPDSPLVKKGYYPTEFKIDYEGKLKEHEGVALLKHVDRDFVQRTYDSASKYIPSNARNTRTSDVTFVYDAGYTARYKNKYGSIAKSHIRTE